MKAQLGFLLSFLCFSHYLVKLKMLRERHFQPVKGQIFTGRITRLGGFAVLEVIVVVWYGSKTTRHCGKLSQMMGVCFPLHQELVYL